MAVAAAAVPSCRARCPLPGDALRQQPLGHDALRHTPVFYITLCCRSGSASCVTAFRREKPSLVPSCDERRDTPTATPDRRAISVFMSKTAKMVRPSIHGMGCCHYGLEGVGLPTRQLAQDAGHHSTQALAGCSHHLCAAAVSSCSAAYKVNAFKADSEALPSGIQLLRHTRVRMPHLPPQLSRRRPADSNTRLHCMLMPRVRRVMLLRGACPLP